MERINKRFCAGLAGLIPLFGMGYIYRNHTSNLIKDSTLYKEAMDAVRQHKGAIYFLGQPIQDLKVNFKSWGIKFGDYSEIKVKVLGPKENGIIFINTKSDKDKNLFLDSVYLQIGKDDSKRLVIKKSSEEKSSDS